MKSTAELIAAGIKAQQAKHAEGESAKLGAYRVGSSGVIALGGKVVGNCMRLAYLRSLGIEVEATSSDREHMFAGGRSNEDIWSELLLAANEAGLVIKREDEYPVSHRLPNGKLVMGRPDIVLGGWEQGFDANGGADLFFKGERILELKAVSAMKTAVEVGTLHRPKLEHVIQAIHYGMRLNLPVELWYTSRVDFNLTDKAIDQVPKGLPNVQYSWNEKAFKILPFIQGFTLRVTETGQVAYRAIGVKDAPEHFTIVTTHGLDTYFDQLSRMEETDSLPPMPSKLDLMGGEASWRKCDYCPLKPVCLDRKKGSVKDWTEAAKQFLSNPIKDLEDSSDKQVVESEDSRP